MTGLSDLSLVNLAFVSSNPPLSLFTLPSLACSSLSLRMRDTLLESDVGENTPEPRPRITPCRRNSLEDLFKWTYDYRGEREEKKKKHCVYTSCQHSFLSTMCWWHFNSVLLEQPSTACSQAAQSLHCPSSPFSRISLALPATVFVPFTPLLDYIQTKWKSEHLAENIQPESDIVLCSPLLWKLSSIRFLSWWRSQACSSITAVWSNLRNKRWQSASWCWAGPYRRDDHVEVRGSCGGPMGF